MHVYSSKLYLKIYSNKDFVRMNSDRSMISIKLILISGYSGTLSFPIKTVSVAVDI